MIYNINKVTSSCVDWNCFEKACLVSNNGVDKSQFDTSFWLGYDENGIYFKYECQDDEIKCKMSGYNEPIYDEETVEFFMCSGGDIKHYLELEWNAVGGVFCAKIFNDLNGNAEISFVEENIIKSEVVMTESGWIVTGFLPKELFDSSLEGEWTFNGYRIKRDENDDMILMAYSPTIIDNFHKPNKFAKMKFIL